MKYNVCNKKKDILTESEKYIQTFHSLAKQRVVYINDVVAE